MLANHTSIVDVRLSLYLVGNSSLAWLSWTLTLYA